MNRLEDRPSASAIAFGLVVLLIAAGLVIIVCVANYDKPVAHHKEVTMPEALPRITVTQEGTESPPVTHKPTPTPTPTLTPTPTYSVQAKVDSYGGYPATVQGPAWVVALQHCIIAHETVNEPDPYHVYNSEGSGAAGAYQIKPDTSDGWVLRYGFDRSLLGVDAAQWSPETQDKLTAVVIANEGTWAWTGSGC